MTDRPENIATETKPMAIVETDGTPLHTTVVMKDGSEVDVTTACRRVEKETGSPVFSIELIALAPPDEIERKLLVRV